MNDKNKDIDVESNSFQDFRSEMTQKLSSRLYDRIQTMRREVADRMGGIIGGKDSMNEESGDKDAYEKFFKAKLKKWGVDSPSDLSDEDKKKFFNEIDDEWEADKEED